MARKNTRAAQAAIDNAQAALAAAEDALGNKPENAYPEAEDAPQGEPDPSTIAEQTYAAIATYDEPQGDEPPPADIGPYPKPAQAQANSMEWFTIGDALTYLGRDSLYPSSHPLHRTMIGVLLHKDGSVQVGAHVWPDPSTFDREAASREAIMAAVVRGASSESDAANAFTSLIWGVLGATSAA